MRFARLLWLGRAAPGPPASATVLRGCTQRERKMWFGIERTPLELLKRHGARLFRIRRCLVVIASVKRSPRHPGVGLRCIRALHHPGIGRLQFRLGRRKNCFGLKPRGHPQTIPAEAEAEAEANRPESQQ